MQTFLFLFESFGIFSWLYLLGCAIAGAAFAHTAWAYKQTQILHLRREQSRLRQELALRSKSLTSRPIASAPVPAPPEPVSPKPVSKRVLEAPVQLPSQHVPEFRPRTSPEHAAESLPTSAPASRVPRKNSLRQDRQLGLVFFLAPDEPDALERLPSITPAQVRDLNMLGVYKFEQVARWDDTNLRSFAGLLGIEPGELVRLDWVHQARVLHGEAHGSKMVLAS